MNLEKPPKFRRIPKLSELAMVAGLHSEVPSREYMRTVVPFAQDFRFAWLSETCACTPMSNFGKFVFWRGKGISGKIGNFSIRSFSRKIGVTANKRPYVSRDSHPFETYND